MLYAQKACASESKSFLPMHYLCYVVDMFERSTHFGHFFSRVCLPNGHGFILTKQKTVSSDCLSFNVYNYSLLNKLCYNKKAERVNLNKAVDQ